MCTEDITLIPLYARDGTVRAYTMIDTADASWVNEDRWHLGSDDRAQRIVSGETVFLHREVMNVDYGNPIIVDHFNRQHLDNRRSNLRLVTQAQNAQNRSKKAPATSKHRGVCWKPARGAKNPHGRWCARLSVTGIAIHVGYYDTEEAAAEAVQAARRKLMSHAVEH